MTDTRPTGTYETRPWFSQFDPHRNCEIRVFIPASLRGPFNVGGIEALVEVEQRLADVNADPDLARIGPILMRSEGIASSRIEGLVMSTRRIYEASERPKDADDRSARQIVGNMDIMPEVLRRTDQPLAHDDLHQWHRAVIEPEPMSRHTIGAYRTVQNWIGSRSDTPAGATFVPPPPDLIPELMDDLLRFINERTLSPIIQAAIAHAQFETIHPYTDGNGRIGRALVYRILSTRGAIRMTAPPISPIIARDRRPYIAGLTAYRDGQPSTWLDTFVHLLDSACGYSLLLAASLADLARSWNERVADVRSNAVDHRIVAGLLDHPILDTRIVAEQFGVSTVAARDALERLAQRGIVVERPLRKGRRGRPPRVFEASDLFDLLDQDPQILAAQRPSNIAGTDPESV
ncbi:MAG: Fic family protein [Actinomycetia bacterium]|nr:Fic family protein [Actinomycetes bacterium]